MANNADKQQLFVIGLPGAGKTTFLAALWHVVESNEADGALKLLSLQGDSSYLNYIRSQWIDANPLERTKVPDETNVLMVLQGTGAQACDLRIPDISGESFDAQWTDRIASSEYCEWVRQSSGGLLFIHPHVREEHLISEINAIIPATGVETDGEATADSDQAQEPPVSWDPKLAPTQVQLVDLVQFLIALRQSRPVRLAVVVSAWDLVANEGTPAKWIEHRLPLLHQFLSSNQDVVEVRHFGLSAQGDDFSQEGASDRMRAHHAPSDRIQLLDGEFQSHDITTPVRWLLEHRPANQENGT